MQLIHNTDTATNTNTDGAHRSAYKINHHIVFMYACSQCCIIQMTLLGGQEMELVNYSIPDSIRSCSAYNNYFLMMYAKKLMRPF